jgi:hypothetical protein
MRQINDALRLTSLMELKKEIEVRKELLRVMVGQLYPSIVSIELRRLNERYSELYYLVKENVNYFTNGNS